MRLPRDHAIDGLRGIAVLGVLICHLSKLCTHFNVWHTEFWPGACGAHLLLIISGFSMAAILHRSSDVGEFFLDRLVKVYPVYAISLVASTAMIWMLKPPVYSVTTSQLLANLTMCQSWLDTPHIDGAHWLVGILLKFYLLTGVAVFVQLTGKRSEVAAYVYLAFAVTWRTAVESGISLPDSIGGCLNIEHAHLLIGGMLLWSIRQLGHSVRRDVAFLMCILLQATHWEMPWGSMIIVGLMLLCYARDHIPLISGSVLRMIGRNTHASYMVHGVLSYVAMKFMMGANFPLVAALPLSILLVLVCAELLTLSVHPLGQFSPRSALSLNDIDDVMPTTYPEYETSRDLQLVGADERPRD